MFLEDLKQEAISSSTSSERLKEIAEISNELARLVASNSHANSQLLDEIAIQARNNHDIETQRAITLNPNTSQKLLIQLACKFPEEFFANPTYDLLTIEAINFNNYYLHFNSILLETLISATNTPTSFLSFAINTCYRNIKRLQKNKVFKQNIKNTFLFKQLYDWEKYLIIISCNWNTSKKQLIDLFHSDNDIISIIAKIHLDCSEDKNKFWNKIALQENPNVIEHIPKKFIYTLAQKSDISSDFLAAVSKLESTIGVLNIVANNPKTSKIILNNLAYHDNPMISESAKLHINYAGELNKNWRKIAEEKIKRDKCYYLKNNKNIELKLWLAGAIDNSNLFYLGKDDIEVFRNTILYIICSPHTSNYILDDLKSDSHVSQLIKDCISFIQKQKSLFLELLPTSLPIEEKKRRYYTINNYNVLSKNDDINTLEDLLIKVADSYWRVQTRWIKPLNDFKDVSFYMCLASLIHEKYYAKITIYSLYNMYRNFGRYRSYPYNPGRYRLSNLEYYGLILAKHPKTSSEILAELTQHIIKEVRVLVASHPNVTQNSLSNLINDRDSEVKAAALANPKLDAILKQEYLSLENSELSLEELQELACSKYKIIREKVALHTNCDRELLIQLSNNKFNVKIAVAKNSKTPTDILLKYIKHPDKRLHFAVAENPSAPLELLIKLATQPESKNKRGYHLYPLNLLALKTLLKYHPDDAIPILDRCLKYPYRPSYARFLVLMNPNISSKFLGRYYKSWFWIERYAIAQNPNTDIEIRQYLANDCNCLVRAAARSFLAQNES